MKILRDQILRTFLPMILLGIIVAGIFCQVGQFKFIHYDDSQYIFHNQHIRGGLTLEGLGWAFTAGLMKPDPNADYWQPMTFLSRMADIQLFKLNPGGHHVMNLFYHILNTLLVFLLLRKLTRAAVPSFFVALYFGVHPLQVEAVAWVTARKDLLSAFFALLAMRCYFDFRKRKSPKVYVLSLLFFLCGLLAKPSIAIVPLWLILIEVVLLKSPAGESTKRISWWSYFKNKIPFFLLGISSLIALRSQPDALAYPWKDFLPRVLGAYLHAIERTLMPVELGIYGGGGQYQIPSFLEIVSALALLGFVTIWVLRRLDKSPVYAVGWFWFLTGLMPVAGLSPEGDRYMYLAGIGLWMMIVWGIFSNALRNPRLKFYRDTVILSLLGILWSVISLSQLQYWRNDANFFAHTVEINPRNYKALNSLGVDCLGKNQYQRAINYFKAAIRAKPEYPDPHHNMGIALSRAGRYEEAVPYFRQAIKCDPGFEMTYCVLADILLKQGKVAEANDLYNKALQLNPGLGDALYGLGMVSLFREEWEQAEKYLAEAAHRQPLDSRILMNLQRVRRHNNSAAVEENADMV